MLGSHTLYRPSLSLQLARSAGPVARAASTSSSPRPPPHHQSLPTSSSAGPDASSPSPSNSTATSSAHALNTSASAHLFALAAEEELVPPRPPSRQPPSVLNPTEHIWDGDEPLSWTVKRMVSDSHKPIRSGKIRSAEEKIRDEMKQREVVARMTGPIPAKVGQSSTSANSAGEEDDLAAGQVKKNTKVWPGHLVGGDPNHRPWHSEYVVPSHDRALIRRGVLLKPPPSTLATSSAGVKPAELPADPVARAALRRVQKLNAGPVRLSSARESALDYEFGGRGGRSGDVGAEEEVHRPSTGMGKEGEGDGEGGKLLEVRMGAGDESLGAGWGSLVELRLEVSPTLQASSRCLSGTPLMLACDDCDRKSQRARAQGQFNNLAGRGKPLEYDSVSPFLSRTEHMYVHPLPSSWPSLSWPSTAPTCSPACASSSALCLQHEPRHQAE